jgi:hypothetical protein
MKDQVHEAPMDNALVRELELAQVVQNREYAAALRALKPESDAGVLEVAGGCGVYAGPGSPMTQGLALGITEPLREADFDRLEAFLGRGGPIQVEVAAVADPSVEALLRARGYSKVEEQRVHYRDLAEPLVPPPPSPAEVRPLRPGEDAQWSRAIGQAFFGQEEVPQEIADLMLPTTRCPSSIFYGAFLDGELVGGGTLGVIGRVAVLSGTGVRAAFRQHGAQRALIHARLEAAVHAGLRWAVSATQPDSGSHRNLERAGFRVAYPKYVYVRLPPGGS